MGAGPVPFFRVAAAGVVFAEAVATSRWTPFAIGIRTPAPTAATMMKIVRRRWSRAESLVLRHATPDVVDADVTNADVDEPDDVVDADVVDADVTNADVVKGRRRERSSARALPSRSARRHERSTARGGCTPVVKLLEDDCASR